MDLRTPSAKPVLLTVDDDAAVLRAVERDLRQRYADRYRVMRADSGMAALDLIRQLQLRNEAVALFVIHIYWKPVFQACLRSATSDMDL